MRAWGIARNAGLGQVLPSGLPKPDGTVAALPAREPQGSPRRRHWVAPSGADGRTRARGPGAALPVLTAVAQGTPARSPAWMKAIGAALSRALSQGTAALILEGSRHGNRMWLFVHYSGCSVPLPCGQASTAPWGAPRMEMPVAPRAGTVREEQASEAESLG